MPFDKEYEELEPAQRVAFRAQYLHLSEKDDPPFPLRGMRKMFQQISDFSQKLQPHGDLVLTVLIDGNGDGQKVDIYKTPDSDFSSVVAYIVLQTKFRPALCNGQPCSMEFPLQMNFQ